MNVQQLIQELQQLPQQLPVRILMSEVYDPECDYSTPLDESDAQPLDRVRHAGGYILLEG